MHQNVEQPGGLIFSTNYVGEGRILFTGFDKICMTSLGYKRIVLL